MTSALAKQNAECIKALEKKMLRIEAILWYVAGALSLQFGSEILPFVSALIK